jgi:hypothetical protein
MKIFKVTIVMFSINWYPFCKICQVSILYFFFVVIQGRQLSTRQKTVSDTFAKVGIYRHDFICLIIFINYQIVQFFIKKGASDCFPVKHEKGGGVTRGQQKKI